MLLGFIGKLEALVGTVPMAVSGGLAIYLFGVIGMQGIALMVENKVNLFNPRTLAVGATIMVVGIGGNIGYPGGFLPIAEIGDIFPNGLPAIATGAVAGIILNAIFLIFEPPKVLDFVTPDDLTTVEGIGPKTSSVLQEAGIETFAQLAKTDVARLKQILEAANLRLADPGSWPEQARLAAAGDWDALKVLQDKLSGGR
jgi:hypothetical protein